MVANDQGLLSFAGDSFFRRIAWKGVGGSAEPATATGYHPQLDSPVVIDPRVRFGRPSIGGVSTEAIAAEIDSGASIDEAAQDFGLTLANVRAAYGYEALRTA